MTVKTQKTKHIFVTGIPTFTAVRLIKELAERDQNARLHILLMEKFIPLAERLIKKLKPAARKRIQLYTGDVTFLDLGLSGQEYSRLAECITHIFHLAAIWEYGVPAPISEHVNIIGVRHILEFAADCKKLKRFYHFSTIYVSGDRQGVIKEDEFDLGQGFKNSLERTRFEGEKLLRRAMADGLPAVVFRLGNVVSDSATGEFMKFEGPYIFLQMLLTTDRNLPFFLPGPCEGPSNLAPVDYVVEACLAIYEQPGIVGRTYHITDPFPMAARSVFTAVCSYLGRKAPTFGIPRSLYKAVFLIPGMERYAGVPKEFFNYFNHKAVHNCSTTLDALKGSGISCPRFESYFPISVEFARDYLKRQLDRKEEEQTFDPFDYPAL